MRFAAAALRERGVPDRRGLGVARAQHAVRVGHCGHCQLGPLFVCRDGPVFRARRRRRGDAGARAVSAPAQPPIARRVEVRVLRRLPAVAPRLRGRAAGARRRDRHRLLPRGRKRARRAPLRPLDRRGLDHDRRTTPSESATSARARAGSSRSARAPPPGGIQALRNFADVDGFVALVYASPEYISTLQDSTPAGEHVPVDFELQGCPPDKGQLLEVIRAYLNERRPAIARPQRVRRVQAARQRVRHGRARHAVPRARSRTRAAARCARPTTAAATAASAPWRRPTPARSARGWPRHGIAERDVVRLYRTFYAGAPAFRRRARLATAEREIVTRGARPGRGRGGHARPPARRAGRGRAAADLRAAALLRGVPARTRASRRCPDITARICGICPVAYQVSSIAAMEDACGVRGARGRARAAAAAVLRRVDREPRAARVHAPRARLPGLRERVRDGP